MRVGYRVTEPEEVGRWGADLVQISLYRGYSDNLARMERIVRACQAKGVPYVLHPVSYPLLDTRALWELRAMSGRAGLAMLLHDERAPGGGRLQGAHERRFREALGDLRAQARVSFENAVDTADAPWFWGRFAESVTLDIGHMESSGLDSAAYVRGLSDECVGKVEFVHMHRNGALRGGLTDHWPLLPGCRELQALRELLKRKRDVGVILEINETWETGTSLSLLRELREAEEG
jgi:sugar phosphate isomerase/epimerase